MRAPWRPLAFSALGLAATVLAADRLGAAYVAGVTEDLVGHARRPPSIVVLPKAPGSLPDPRSGRSVLLIGNSHTFALPGLAKGEPLRPDPGVTLIDRLAAEVRARHPGADPTFYRLAYPNFLPFEMLVRVGQMLERGYRPDVVVVGLTWRNIARDSLPRHQIRTTFDDERFGPALIDRLGPGHAEVRARIDAEIAEAARRREEERTRSSADRIDRRLTRSLGRHSALIGSSRALRMRLYRAINVVISDVFVPARREGTQYDSVAEDLRFNRDCLVALLSMLHGSGARVILYRAPERSDFAPLIDTAGRAEVEALLAAEADQRGFAFIDARRVVPDELWGWAYETPDQSHFVEKGHELLGAFIVESSSSAWSRLE
jgi:hypothetical protein